MKAERAKGATYQLPDSTLAHLCKRMQMCHVGIAPDNMVKKGFYTLLQLNLAGHSGKGWSTN